MANFLFSICARGGSKGIKNKNITEYHSKYLIQWSIDKILVLKKKKDKFIISTNSKKIFDICKKNQILVRNRPKKLCGDRISKFYVWKDLINYSISKNFEFDYLLDIDCSNPLQYLKDIKSMMSIASKNLNNKNFDGIIMISNSHKNPYFNMLEKRKNNSLKKIISSNYISRQTSPKTFDHVAGTYILRKQYLIDNQNLFDGNINGFEVSKLCSYDIDDHLDLDISKIFFKKYKFDKL